LQCASFNVPINVLEYLLFLGC